MVRPYRGRVGVWGLAAGMVLTACTGGGGGGRHALPSSGGPVIAAFAEAWQNPSRHGLAGVVDKPKTAAHDMADYAETLEISHTAVHLVGDLQCSGASCREHASVTHLLAGAGEWHYPTLITSARVGGRWRVIWTPATFEPQLTAGTSLVRRRSLPSRAPIQDRHGVALTPERPLVRIGLLPKKVRAGTYPALSGLLGIDAGALRPRVDAAQPDWFVPVIDLRRPAYLPLRHRLLQLPGIVVDPSRRALAPTAEWARAVLGAVEPATAETLRAAGPEALATDEVGSDGLQRVFQQRLAGTPGIEIDLVHAAVPTGVAKRLLVRPPQPGRPLRTTLDKATQTAAEQAVSHAADLTSLVVVQASTGDILAAANAPGPTSYNTAFVGRYAPGSTFKIVSAAALMQTGIVTPSAPITCPDTVVVGGKRFKNYLPHLLGRGSDFADAFAASCNTAFVGFAPKITGSELATAGRRFGFGAPWSLGLDSYSGSTPDDTGLVTRAADMIGQGRVLASPLMMAMVAAAVDSGSARPPTLLPGINRSGTPTRLDPTTVARLRQLMRLTVTHGTGDTVDLPGLPVYAKTGTAEYQQGKRTGTNAWLVGFRGDVAFAAFVANGRSGSGDAGPIVASLLRDLPARTYR